jgi:hypothetical protein
MREQEAECEPRHKRRKWKHGGGSIQMQHTVLILTALLAGVSTAPVVQRSPGDQAAHAMLAAVKTGKERLSDKASDEQRQDDCKVPEARRTKPRPAGCHEGS